MYHNNVGYISAYRDLPESGLWRDPYQGGRLQNGIAALETGIAVSKKLNSRPNNRQPAQRGEQSNAQVPGVEYGVLDELVGYSIRRAQIRIYQDFLDALGPWSITPPRFSAMTIIQSNTDMKLTELANAMGIARSGAVEVVNSLEKLGYATRTESTVDKRAHALALTDAGREALRGITQAIREHDARISARLTAAEQKELRRLLDSLG
jgi:DNA-binding MarR family transcriptional regulator